MDEVNAIGGIKQFYEANPGILDQARTMAFVTLAFSELTHMIGMSDVKHSFIHIFKDKNWMMALAFALGIVLQIIVVMVPGINSIFKTSWLSLMEWLIAIGLCLIPIVIHEFLVLVWHKHTRNK